MLQQFATAIRTKRAEPVAKLQEAFAFFEGFSNLERSRPELRDFRLDRMDTLLKAFDRPERAFPSFHLAGSKGKGSTAAFLASILASGGFRTGLYTSPHLRDYGERFRILPETKRRRRKNTAGLIRTIEQLRSKLEVIGLTGGEPPTTFELLTLAAFLFFRRMKTDYGVIETGLGGRLDATNLVTPICTVITSIELEHTEVLGSSIEEIAREKAGIIKKGVPLLIGRLSAEAEQVIRETARKQEAPFYRTEDLVNVREVIEKPSGTRVEAELAIPLPDSTPRKLALSAQLGLPGGIQVQNALTAAAAAGLTFPLIPARQIETGLAAASLPGRFEQIAADPPFFIDGAHTPSSVSAAARSFEARFGRNTTLLFASVSGKDDRGMAAALAGMFNRVIVTSPGTVRPSSPRETYGFFQQGFASAFFEPDTKKAVDQAVAFGNPVLAIGSFYFAAEILHVLSPTRG
ncbi:MAG: bifunctional folylpolyglutamate synthase/dihydrofolate synthase [Spirochaetales bacterium]|nr:bifunctional folylpolyglutamate synthase/dihydrofolate synthase [Spirochaetales bacterium]MCF7937875.1 bifunctional folylpolyglutamate synthase/dihydrofolate synthase [Spirochaetales bacterium]